MTLEEKAKVMRDAIDKMELALMGFGNLPELVQHWGDPKHRAELGVILRTNCGQVYQVNDALNELNRIVHSPDFNF